MSTPLKANRPGFDERKHSDSVRDALGPSENGFSPRALIRAILDPDYGIGGDLDAGQRAALSALVAETDEGTFWRDLFSWGGRLELAERYGAAAAIYAVAARAARDPDLKESAQSRLDALHGKGAFGARFEILLHRFAQDACDPSLIFPMMVGSGVYGLTRAATLSRLAATVEGGFLTRGMAVRFAASSIGLFAEVPAFALATRGLRHALGGGNSEAEPSVGQDLAGAAITLGFLKTAAFLGQAGLRSPGGNPTAGPALRLAGGMRAAQFTLGQGAVFLGLMAAHRVEEQIGLRPHVEGGTVITDTLASMLGLSVGARLGRSLVGRYFPSWEWEAVIRDRASVPAERPRAPDHGLQPAFSASGTGPGAGSPYPGIQSGLSSAMGFWDRVKTFVSGKKSAPILEDRRKSDIGRWIDDPNRKAELQRMRKVEGYRIKTVSPEERERVLQWAADSRIHPKIFLARYLSDAPSPEVEGWMEVLFPNDWARRLQWIHGGKVRGGARFVTDLLRLPPYLYGNHLLMVNTLVEMDVRESLPVLKGIADGFEHASIHERWDKYLAAIAVLQLEGGYAIQRTFHQVLYSEGTFRELDSADSDIYEWQMRLALAKAEFKQGNSKADVLETLSGGRSYSGLLRISKSNPGGLVSFLGEMGAVEPLIYLWGKIHHSGNRLARSENGSGAVNAVRLGLGPEYTLELARALLKIGQEGVIMPKVRELVKASSHRELSLYELEILALLAEPDIVKELLSWHDYQESLRLADLFAMMGETNRARETVQRYLQRERWDAADLMDNLSPGWDRFIRDLRVPHSGPYR